MPVIDSVFRAPLLMGNAHLQTLWVCGAGADRSRGFQVETLELPDGDFLSLGWRRCGAGRLAVLCHGLEGSMDAGYIRTASKALAEAGWDTLAWNLRGCGSAPNRLLPAYHSGKTDDLAAVIQHAAPRYGAVALVGFSLGGNLVLKYLGEAAPHPKVSAAVAISAPVDLRSTACALDSKIANRIYLKRFLQTLNAKMREKRSRFPCALADVTARSLREFDEIYTAPLHGFSGAEDYWAKSSGRQFLGRIAVRSLLLNAGDDPFLGRESFPWEEARENPHFCLEVPVRGGHLGFVEWRGGFRRWWAGRMLEFLEGGDV